VNSRAQAVSVVIPTLGLRVRESLLWRTVENVLDQEGVRAVPIVVLNGQEADPAVESRLRNDGRVRLVRLENPTLPGSLDAGRAAVETPWFSELDDDDLFLPGALARRLRALEEDREADVVVTNGIRRGPAGDVVHVQDMARVARDPLHALIRGNWLLPGAWLCRTDRVAEDVFRNIPAFRECTYLAIQFASRFRVRYLEEPTVIWHTDSPASTSSSPDYVLSGASAIRQLLELDLPPRVRAQYRRGMSEALHNAADFHWKAGHLGRAWRSHLASLRWPGGLRYLAFSGRLFFPRPPT
jgi:glycosyltransferase involved in cell wall biosynthesis